MEEFITNNVTIKASFNPSIIDPSILKHFMEREYTPFYYDQSVIESGTTKLIWIIQHFS